MTDNEVLRELRALRQDVAALAEIVSLQARILDRLVPVEMPAGEVLETRPTPDEQLRASRARARDGRRPIRS